MTAAPIWIPYCGAAPLPAELLTRWNFDPLLLAGLALIAAGYLRGGHSRESGNPAAFTGSLILLAILFISPFCALTSALFSARVVHHALLAVAAAPLLAWSLPIRLRGGLAVWTAAQAVIFWLWHAPPAYAWALSSDAAYWLMQLSLLGGATAFWSALRRAPPPAAVAALLATMVQMGLLGALITFAGAPLYAPHLTSTIAWGLAPLEDQQLAGIIMWAPSSAAYLFAALLLLGRYLRSGGAPVAVR